MLKRGNRFFIKKSNFVALMFYTVITLTKTTGDFVMTTLNIPEKPEKPIKTSAENALERQAVQDDTDVLLIHEQLMEQYAETFEKLAQ
jgi:hypothetical protein